jgi:hypothetical protein
MNLPPSFSDASLAYLISILIYSARDARKRLRPRSASRISRVSWSIRIVKLRLLLAIFLKKLRNNIGDLSFRGRSCRIALLSVLFNLAHLDGKTGFAAAVTD